MTTHIAIYTRVSKEDLEVPASTRRQERACRQFAKSKGWAVTDVFEDVDVSAYSKRTHRHAFERLIIAVAGGQVDGVLVWKLDRLVRRMADFERFWTRCDEAGIFLASANEPIDTTTELGLAVVRILVTFAQVESTSIGLRIKSRMEEKARAGTPILQGRRMFGFTTDFTEIVESEGALIREAADSFLAGASMEAIALDWQARQVPFPGGGPWSRNKVSRLLSSPRLAGDNTFHGEVVKRGCFPAILDQTTSARIRSQLADHHWTRHPSGRYLLPARLVQCSTCNGPMYGFVYVRRIGDGTKLSVRSYRCDSDRRDGLRHSQIDAQFLEALVSSAVIEHLEQLGRRRPSLRSPDQAPPALADIYEHHASALRTLVTDYYVRRQLSREEWEAARDGLESQLRALLHEHGRGSVTTTRISKVRSRWASLEPTHRRDIITSAVERITITPTKAQGRIDARRVQISWWEEAGHSGSWPPVTGSTELDVWDDTHWMGTGEVAELLRVPRQSVILMAHAGELPVEKLRGKLRYRRSDIGTLAGHFRSAMAVEDAATALGASPQIVASWVATGRLPAFKSRGRYYVTPDDLERFADGLRAAHEELIGTLEAARLLGVKLTTMWTIAQSGRIDVVRHGRVYLMRREDVMKEAERRRGGRALGRRGGHSSEYPTLSSSSSSRASGS